MHKIMLGIIVILLIFISIAGGHYLTKNDKTLSFQSFAKADTITLKSRVCNLTLDYPKEWKGEVTEGQSGCMFRVENPINKLTYLILNPILNTTWADITSQNPQNTPFIINGIEGIKISDQIEDEVIMEAIYFQKGNNIYEIVYSYQQLPEDPKVVFDEIINSIRFINNGENQNEPFTNGVQEAMNQADDQIIDIDMRLLDSALLQYHNQNQSYPLSLLILLEKGFLPEIPQDPHTKEMYKYSSDGQTFSLSATKSDGTPIIISK